MPRKFNVDQKTVQQLFSENVSDFLIPDYQRPYAWTEEECFVLWDDIFSFAFPDNDYERFDNSDEYFLGPIVIFRNPYNKFEVIDGQQRLTTLMLLLRAFYEAHGINMHDERTLSAKHIIEQCIWKTDEFDRPNKAELKIESEVATDNDKKEFTDILLTGEAPKRLTSRYAANYRFFQDKIKHFIEDMPTYFPYMTARILKNCILLPIEAESQDTAFRIFSTLNDRGKPLSDSDIFKAQLYKAFLEEGMKDEFISQWRELESMCETLFKSSADNPVDEIFTRYMYFERARRNNRNTTIEGLRRFYESDNYRLLRENHKQTFENIITLANFWNDVANQDKTRFSEKVLRRFFVLNYAPNGLWTYIVSVYFLHNKDDKGNLDDEKFYSFLNVITAFIWASTILGKGVSTLRSPILNEIVNIIEGRDVTFAGYQITIKELKNALNNSSFSNKKPITRAMLAWYAFNNENQKLIPIETMFDIEHIYAKNRFPISKNVDALGNKSFLEKKINIHASDYRFGDKKKHYLGRIPGKPRTQIYDLAELAETQEDFKEEDITSRNRKIFEDFIKFVRDNHLLQTR